MLRLQLTMCSRWRRMKASIWQRVVLPTPVSPTSSAASLCSRHLQRAGSEVSVRALSIGAVVGPRKV